MWASLPHQRTSVGNTLCSTELISSMLCAVLHVLTFLSQVITTFCKKRKTYKKAVRKHTTVRADFENCKQNSINETKICTGWMWTARVTLRGTYKYDNRGSCCASHGQSYELVRWMDLLISCCSEGVSCYTKRVQLLFSEILSGKLSCPYQNFSGMKYANRSHLWYFPELLFMVSACHYYDIIDNNYQ